ncbi:MAG: ATP-binding protein [Bacteroidota bacterium]
MKIAITGPESSGKSAIAMEVAEHLGYVYLPELARVSLQSIDYDFDDVQSIAKSQMNLWNQYDDGVVLDTDVNVLEIWFEEKFDRLPDFWPDFQNQYPVDITFLCAPDIPYEEDPLRENPHDRDRLFELYEELLKGKGLKYVVLKGSMEERMKTVINAVN